MSARDSILARLGDAPGDAIATEAAALLFAVERPNVDAADLEAAFLASLALPSINASHDRIDRLADLPRAVARYLSDQAMPPALYLPPDPRLGIYDWSGLARQNSVPTDGGAALAIARCGIAETGSLVFETADNAPMLPNFLALHHIILLPTSAIRAHLEDAILPAGPQPRAHYWITGVSGTTDIEGSYVRGAHGPRFEHVILTDEDWP